MTIWVYFRFIRKAVLSYLVALSSRDVGGRTCSAISFLLHSAFIPPFCSNFTLRIKSRIMKYPIGIQSFEKIREGGYVYVDKTELVYSLVNDGTVYFLSRPRRFGKSLLVSTLGAYFQGKKELFEGLSIEELEKDWKRYPVFHVDFSVGEFTKSGVLEQSIGNSLSTWEKQYGIDTDLTDFGLRFKNIIAEAHRQSGQQAVVLVDEYDKPILDVMDTDITVEEDGRKLTLEDHNREVLKGFYSTFKAADADLRFVLLTGVTKFSQVSVFSGFNQPLDISMLSKYETLCGITQDELVRYFDNEVGKMAESNGYTKDEMYDMLKSQYDGYHFSRNMIGVYNPFSLLNALNSNDIQDYWFKTGTPTYLMRLMLHFNEDLDEMTGKYYKADKFADYRADLESPLPMIYQSGYLTIKDYDREMRTFLLDFPNDEVKEGFVSLTAANYFCAGDGMDTVIQNLTISLRKGDLEAFRTHLTSFLASIPYTMRRKENERERERYFHYTFYLLLRLISVYTVYTEKEQSQGRVDCIIEAKDNVYIFEFKLDGTAEEALKQIEDKGYAKPYVGDKRKVYKIGVSFSSETGTIEGWKAEEA